MEKVSDNFSDPAFENFFDLLKKLSQLTGLPFDSHVKEISREVGEVGDVFNFVMPVPIVTLKGSRYLLTVELDTGFRNVLTLVIDKGTPVVYNHTQLLQWNCERGLDDNCFASLTPTGEVALVARFLPNEAMAEHVTAEHVRVTLLLMISYAWDFTGRMRGWEQDLENLVFK